MELISYEAEYQPDFERLNRAWLEKYFKVEPLDEQLLSDPEQHILQKGGSIWFVRFEHQIIGTAALIPMSPSVYELAKMTVDEQFQGRGAGKFLCSAMIAKARELGAAKVVLFTASSLTTALHIYNSMGFRKVALEGSQFERGDIRMELDLNPG